MFSASLISMFGWMSVKRIFSKWSTAKIISDENFFYAEILALFLSFVPLALRFGGLGTAVYFLLLMVLSAVIPSIIEWRRKSEFNDTVVSAMDAILLSLKAGRSFRDSLMEICQGDVDYGFYLQEISTLILLRQTFSLKNTDRRIQRVYFELKLADQSTHRIADRIKSFRYQLKTEELFRQKSRMATLQARAQSIVVGILYFLALIFDFLNFSTNLDVKMLAISALLFTLGTLWIWNLGRRHQWKV